MNIKYIDVFPLLHPLNKGETSYYGILITDKHLYWFNFPESKFNKEKKLLEFDEKDIEKADKNYKKYPLNNIIQVTYKTGIFNLSNLIFKKNNNELIKLNIGGFDASHFFIKIGLFLKKNFHINFNYIGRNIIDRSRYYLLTGLGFIAAGIILYFASIHYQTEGAIKLKGNILGIILEAIFINFIPPIYSLIGFCSIGIVIIIIGLIKHKKPDDSMINNI